MNSIVWTGRLQALPAGGTQDEEQNKDSDAAAEDGIPGGVHKRPGLHAFQVFRA